jgi:hypothetical protein
MLHQTHKRQLRVKEEGVVRGSYTYIVATECLAGVKPWTRLIGSWSSRGGKGSEKKMGKEIEGQSDR